MKQCTTHHHACDCRERDMKMVCNAWLRSHNIAPHYDEISRTYIAKYCRCDICEAVRRLYGDAIFNEIIEEG